MSAEQESKNVLCLKCLFCRIIIKYWFKTNKISSLLTFFWIFQRTFLETKSLKFRIPASGSGQYVISTSGSGSQISFPPRSSFPLYLALAGLQWHFIISRYAVPRCIVAHFALLHVALLRWQYYAAPCHVALHFVATCNIALRCITLHFNILYVMLRLRLDIDVSVPLLPLFCFSIFSSDLSFPTPR